MSRADREVDPVRVLLVVGRAAGGIGEHCADLAARLADDPAVDLRVFAHPFTAARFDLGRHVQTGWPRLRHPASLLPALLQLRRAARAAHVVHAQGHQAGVLSVVALLGLSRAPALVVSWHNAVLGSGLRRRVRSLGERLQARRATLMSGASDDLVARAAQLGARRAELALVPAPERPRWNGDRTRTRAELAAELGISTTATWALTVARLAPQKRLDVAVDAAGLLARAHGADGGAGHRDLVWLVAGEGDPDAVQALTARAQAARAPVVLLGARTDVSRLMIAADVVVVTSDWEARALVVQEAMALGTPVVVTAVGGLPGLVGDAGVQVSPGLPTEIARAVAALVADPLRGVDLARAGLERAASWPDAQACAEAWRVRYVALRGAAAPGH